MSNERLLPRLLILTLTVALILGFLGDTSASSGLLGNQSASETEILILGHPPRDTTPPVANAGPDQSVDEDVPVQFDGSDSTDNVGIKSYVWTFVDDTLKTLNGIAPTYTFSNPGIYAVTLTVSDAARNWNTDTMVVTVRDITPPVANAGPDQSVDEDVPVQFDGANSDDNVGVTSYVWTFIDDTAKILDGSVPTYIFQDPGNYTVTLNVSDAAGNWGTDSITIIVRDITPPAIGQVSQTPSENVTVGQLVWVSANITDAGTGVKNVTLTYSNDNGTSWRPPLRMVFNSTSGVYETIILGHIYGTWIKYKITAFDNAGNSVIEDNAGLYYSYQVIPEFPGTRTIILLLLVTTLCVLTIERRRLRARSPFVRKVQCSSFKSDL